MRSIAVAATLLFGAGGGGFYAYNSPNHGMIGDVYGNNSIYTNSGNSTFYSVTPPVQSFYGPYGYSAYGYPMFWVPPAYGANPYSYPNSSGLIYAGGMGYPQPRYRW